MRTKKKPSKTRGEVMTRWKRAQRHLTISVYSKYVTRVWTEVCFDVSTGVTTDTISNYTFRYVSRRLLDMLQ